MEFIENNLTMAMQMVDSLEPERVRGRFPQCTRKEIIEAIRGANVREKDSLIVAVSDGVPVGLLEYRWGAGLAGFKFVWHVDLLTAPHTGAGTALMNYARETVFKDTPVIATVVNNRDPKVFKFFTEHVDGIADLNLKPSIMAVMNFAGQRMPSAGFEVPIWAGDRLKSAVPDLWRWSQHSPEGASLYVLSAAYLQQQLVAASAPDELFDMTAFMFKSISEAATQKKNHQLQRRMTSRLTRLRDRMFNRMKRGHLHYTILAGYKEAFPNMGSGIKFTNLSEQNEKATLSGGSLNNSADEAGNTPEVHHNG